MSSYGGVHIFKPKFTKPDPADPSKRVLKTSPNYAYRFQYRCRGHQKGGFATAAEARREGEKRKGELRAGIDQDWRTFTLGGLYHLAQARKVLWAPTSGASFEHAWKRLFKELPATTYVVDIDDTALLRLVAKWKAQGAAVNTINLTLKNLKTAMRIANSKRLLPWIPEFPRLKYQRREQTVNPVALREILQHLPEHYRLYIEAADEIGWRARSELSTRTVADVDQGPDRWPCACAPPLIVSGDDCPACGAGRPGWLRLDAESSKTDTARAFPMTRRLRSILVRAQLYREGVQLKTGRIVSWLFPRPDGGRIANCGKAWRQACAKAGLGKLPGRVGPWSGVAVVHDVRRTAIRRWHALGLDRESAKGLAGHVSDKAHAIYEAQGQDAEALRRAALVLDRQSAEAGNVLPFRAEDAR